MSPSMPLNGCEINVRFCFECFSSLDVSEIFVSGVSSMYNVIMQYLNSFLSCSIRNLTLASLSLLFTIFKRAGFMDFQICSFFILLVQHGHFGDIFFANLLQKGVFEARASLCAPAGKHKGLGYTSDLTVLISTSL